MNFREESEHLLEIASAFFIMLILTNRKVSRRTLRSVLSLLQNTLYILVYKAPTMNKLLLLSLFCLMSLKMSAQSVYSAKYESQADVTVFVVGYESQADLLVFKEKYESRAKGNSGHWHFVDYESRADKTLYFVKYASQADLKVYFVEYESRAGWRNKDKVHLLY